MEKKLIEALHRRVCRENMLENRIKSRHCIAVTISELQRRIYLTEH